MNYLKLKKISGNISGTIALPGSKSLSNRLLIIQSIANESFDLDGLSLSDDTVRMTRILKYIKICGTSGIPLVIDTANAGTVMRFVVALLSGIPQKWLVTGCERMNQRPIGGLVDALRSLGAQIEYVKEEGYPPLRINGRDFKGGQLWVDATKSSQFISALMLVAPYLIGGLHIHLKGKAVSRPYIDMTAQLMRKMGIKVKVSSKSIRVSEGFYVPQPIEIEPDWSAAAYWYQLVSLSDHADIFLSKLQADSLQGDCVLTDIYAQLGVHSSFENGGLRLTKGGSISEAFEFDFRDCPDLAPSVIVSCMAKGIEAKFVGVTHLKYKESDRIQCLKMELQALGAILTERGTDLYLTYKRGIDMPETIVFNTYGDHRMAMSLAPLVLLYENIQIEKPEVVLKSYPGFWDDLKRLQIVE